MIYICLLILSYLFISINRALLGIPGFFYYSSVRPVLKMYFREKLFKVEEVYYWEMAESLGDRALWSILPAYVLAFDLLDLSIVWVKAGTFLFINYMWCLFYAATLVKEYIPQTPALRPRVMRASSHL